MRDQATHLREIFQETRNLPAQPSQSAAGELKTIAFTSGKGGVGKTNICLNLGIALAQAEKKVVVIDADLNMGNIDVLLGLSPKFTLRNVIAGEKKTEEILIEGPAGIKIVPSSSGAPELVDLDSNVRRRLAKSFHQLRDDFDYLLLDVPAGVGQPVFDFLEYADQTVIVTTPEPTAIVDTYALMKTVWQHTSVTSPLHLLINSVSAKEEAEEVVRKLSLVTEQFLSQKIGIWSFIQFDANVGLAVRQQQAFMTLFPDSAAAVCVNRIGGDIVNLNNSYATKTRRHEEKTM